MILVIEDEPHIRQLLTMNLARRGYEVVSVDSAEAGLAYIHQRCPSLLFLDIKLPGMSGLDLLAAVDADPSLPNFCIVLMSAHNIDTEDFSSPRVVDVLRKPLGVSDIMGCVERARIQPTCQIAA